MELRIPGPTPLPPEVRQALSEEMIGHRSSDFRALHEAVTRDLQRWFQTEGSVFILTASGTGAMEAAVVNALSPGDRVLAVSIGHFGVRFADIAEAHGASVTRLEFQWGRAADPESVFAALSKGQGYAAVLVTHNETSTGVTNDLVAISRAIDEMPGERPMLIVDAVSSLGAIELRSDEWGCDLVLTASQKALMTPPGLSFISVNDRVWPRIQSAGMPRFYWDLQKARAYAERGQTPFTPAVSTLYGLRQALALMSQEGMDQVFARHRRLGSAVRDGVKALGLQLFADETHASNTVTTVRVPDGWSAEDLLGKLQQNGVVLAGGQGPHKGKIFRIAHMGHAAIPDMERVLGALRSVLGREAMNLSEE